MKHLIVNADDFGYTSGVNRAIVEASRARSGGIITSTSLIANAPAFDEAVELARNTLELDVGCHLNLVEGAPLAPPAAVPGLVGRSGRFGGAGFLARALLRGRARLEELERECAAQVERLLAAGIQLSHLDTHQHTHLHPRVALAVARTARRFGIRWVRRPYESFPRVGHAHFQRRLLAGGLNFFRRSFDRIMAEHELCTPQHFAGFVLTGQLFAPSMLALLEQIADGTTEVMCHPGYADSDLAHAHTKLVGQRQREFEALRSPEVQSSLRKNDIHLTSFRELAASPATQAAWIKVHPAVAGKVEAGRM